MTDAAGTTNPVERVIAALEAHGSRVRRHQRGVTAQCPAHEDNSPSLSVTESETGNALVYCHAGCTTAEVCHELELELRDLFPPQPPKVAHIGPAGRFKASYQYVDDDGEILFRVVRYEPKTFRQQHPDGKGGWLNGVDGITQVPFHLPQIRRAVTIGKTVWICEGEKDVENAEFHLREHGIAATCNAMGAGKWRDEHARHLYGATKIVIGADNDRVGHDHARTVLRSLQGHVDRIIVVTAAVGKDITDHFQAGKTLTDFVTLWDSEAPSDWLDGDDTGQDDGLPVPIDWSTFWERDTGPEWLVEPLIPLGRHVVLYAPAKAGKSLLALEVAAAIATGRPVLGQPAHDPVTVVYLDFEMTEDDLAERLGDMGYGPETDLGRLNYYSLPDLPPLDTNAGGLTIEAIVRRHDAQLVIVDTMARVVQGEENSADTYRWFDMHTSLRMKALRVAVLRLDHAGKDVGKGQRGSSEKVGYADLVWRLTYDEATSTVTMKATHRRQGWVPETLTLSRVEEPSLAHLLEAGAATYLPGTQEAARDLDELGAPVDITRRAAEELLRTAGKGRRSKVVTAALKFRKRGGNHANGDSPDGPGGVDGEPETVTNPDLREPPREPSGTNGGAPAGNHPHLSIDAVGPAYGDPPAADDDSSLF